MKHTFTNISCTVDHGNVPACVYCKTCQEYIDHDKQDGECPRPEPKTGSSVMFWDLPVGAMFSGEVTSIRSGETIQGHFIKVAHRCLLTEHPSDERTTEDAFNADPPYMRFIRPVQVVLILSSEPPLASGRVPIFLDDLEVRNYKTEYYNIAVMGDEHRAKMGL